MDDMEYIKKAIKWGLIAKCFGVHDKGALMLSLIGPVIEKPSDFPMISYPNETATVERNWLGQERQKSMDQIISEISDLQAQIRQGLPGQGIGMNSISSLPPTSLIEKDAKWREIIVHPSVVLVLGKRGSGKSALGYRLLELFRYKLNLYVLGIPASGQSLLPDWIGIAKELDEIPAKSIVLVDEAYIRYHSRDSMAADRGDMSRILNLSRQRDQTLVFVSQEARQIDKNIASSANVVVFKDPGLLQAEYDRPQLARIAAKVRQTFETVKGDRREWSYVWSPDTDFEGLQNNSLPGFWSPKLSRLFAIDAKATVVKHPKKKSRKELIEKAKELHQAGHSYRDISKILGVSEGTVYNYVKDYPYIADSSQ